MSHSRVRLGAAGGPLGWWWRRLAGRSSSSSQSSASSGPATAEGGWGCGPRPRRTWSTAPLPPLRPPTTHYGGSWCCESLNTTDTLPAHTHILYLLCLLHYLDEDFTLIRYALNFRCLSVVMRKFLSIIRSFYRNRGFGDHLVLGDF